MPFLATMPTPMMAPRKETTFSVVAGEPQRRDGAEQRQHRAEHDGDGLVEGAELDQQHGEDEHDRHGENEQQVAKRFLLLLIEAAELDHSGGQRSVGAELAADLRHGAAEIAPFEPRRHRHVLAQILAAQFELARDLDDVGDLRELHEIAVGGAQRQFAQRRHFPDAAAVDPHADVDHAVAFEHARGALARASRY